MLQDASKSILISLSTQDINTVEKNLNIKGIIKNKNLFSVVELQNRGVIIQIRA